MSVWAVILLVALIGAALGLLPNWAHMQPHALGYAPSGVALLLAVVLIILVLTGKI